MFPTAISLSLSKDFLIVIVAFIIVLFTPLFIGITITQTGISFLSQQLISINPKTSETSFVDPLSQTKLTKIPRNISWPSKGVFTLLFGETNLPYQVLHTGIDIAGSKGESIHAFLPGTVLYADEISWGYGKHIIIDHGNNITTLYAHLDKANVLKGDNVNQGQQIGTQGKTGWATGVHLHFEIRYLGIPVNPQLIVSN